MEVFESSQGEVLLPAGGGFWFEARLARKESGENDLRLHPREGGPRAEVDPIAKADVTALGSRHIEAVGVGKLLRVSVGRPDKQEQSITRDKLLAMELELVAHDARERVSR